MKCYIAINYIIAKLENEYKMQYYDIKKLLKFCLKVDDKYLIIHNNDNLDEKIVKQIFTYAERIKSGIPIQYLINEQDFMQLSTVQDVVSYVNFQMQNKKITC